jgi:PadR family transcriptional regulator PadR
MRYISQLLKGNTDLLLLSLLQEESMYGYQIMKELDRRSRGYFKFREGTLYPALHRMEYDGYISGRWRRLSGGQERRYYSLTPKGHRRLAEQLVQWQGFATAVRMITEPA